MAATKDRWTVKKLMIVIALLAVILYCGKLYMEGYIWMITAVW